MGQEPLHFTVKSAFIVVCLLGAAFANPVLYKMRMVRIEDASNSVRSESSSLSESSEETLTSGPSDESSESLESDSAEQTFTAGESDSVETLTGEGENTLTSDDAQRSGENVRRGWIYTLKWVHTNRSGEAGPARQSESESSESSEEGGASESSEEGGASESSAVSSSESEELLPLDIGDDGGAADPFNGLLMPDYTER